MGVTVVTDKAGEMSDDKTTPLVEVIAGNPVFGGTLQPWIAYGSCMRINTFDGLMVFGTGQRIAGFVDPNGGDYGFAAATLNVMGSGSRAVSMPVDLMFVYTDPSATGNDLSGRAQLLKDVLAYFGVVGDPQNVSPVLPNITFQTSNYPNPFNPSTTIK